MPFQQTRAHPATAKPDDSNPRDDAAQRLKLSLIFTLPLTLASFNHARLANDWSTFIVICGGSPRVDIGFILNGWLQLVIASPVVLWLALPIFNRGLTLAGKGKFEAASALACLLIAAPFLYSVYVLIMYTLIPPPNAGAITLYFTVSAALSTGFWLASYVKALGK